MELISFWIVLIAGMSCINAHLLAARRALIIVDVQNCFLPGGTLAVDQGQEVIPVINHIRDEHEAAFDLVVVSQDWHCPDHVSFASQHAGYGVLDSIELYYNGVGDLCRTVNVTNSYAVPCTGATQPLQQTLWPDHCVKNTDDAKLHPNLTLTNTDVLITKGHKCNLDSYSVFYDNGRFGETPLRQLVEDKNIEEIYITGLATDYCVYWSAKDAKELGYRTYVVVDATRGVAEDTTTAAIQDMTRRGIHVINSSDMDVTPTSGAAPLTSFPVIIGLALIIQFFYSKSDAIITPPLV